MRSAISFAVVVATLAGCRMTHGGGALEGRASDEWTRSYPLAAGAEVQIVAGNGSVDVQGGSGSTVSVRAERVARAATDAAARELVPRIQIREDITPERVLLQTQGLGGIVIGVEIEVHYHLTVPAGAHLRLRAANGGVTVADVAGRVVISSANGDVIGKNLRGGVDATSVNNPLIIGLAAFGSEPVDLRSTNGHVELALPADTNASLEANATNGTIDIQGLTFDPFGEQSKSRIRGRLNAGGTPIKIIAVDGDIHVRPR